MKQVSKHYVDLDLIIDHLEDEWGYEGMREELYELPSVDIVRCKDCVNGIENGEFCGRKVYLCTCMTNPNEFYGDFYCAWGERKETE